MQHEAAFLRPAALFLDKALTTAPRGAVGRWHPPAWRLKSQVEQANHSEQNRGNARDAHKENQQHESHATLESI